MAEVTLEQLVERFELLEQEPRVRFGDGETDTMLAAAAEKFLRWMYEHDRPGFARVMSSALYGVDLRAPVKHRA
jgi:hypothetical protein